MSNSHVKVIVPFRDRGLDPRRAENLKVVEAWWLMHGFSPEIVSDGLDGDAQFNRHRAYNRAVERFPETQVFVFTEADMLIHPSQITEAVRLAEHRLGLVVPFTQYRYWSDDTTARLRGIYRNSSAETVAALFDKPMYFTAGGEAKHRGDSVFHIPAESVMDNGKSIGAVNVVSRETLRLTGGFTEATSGNWYDDNIIEEGFRYLTGNPTRWVEGPAVHLYHLPGHSGEHLSAADKAATAHNKNLLLSMRRDIARRDTLAVKTLMGARDLTSARPHTEERGK